MRTLLEERKTEFMVLILTAISTVLCVCSLYFPNWMQHTEHQTFVIHYYGLFKICIEQKGINPSWVCRTTTYINDSTRRLTDVYKVTAILWGMSNLLSIAATIMTIVSGQYWSRRNLYATACLSLCTCLLALITSIVFGVSHRNVGGTFDFAFYLGLSSIIVNIATFLTTINKANDYEEESSDVYDIRTEENESFYDCGKRKERNTDYKVWDKRRSDNSDEDDCEIEVVLHNLLEKDRGQKSISNLTVPLIKLNGQEVSYTDDKEIGGNNFTYWDSKGGDSDSDVSSTITTSTSNLGTPTLHNSLNNSKRKLSIQDQRPLEADQKHKLHSSTYSIYSSHSEHYSAMGLLLGALSGSSLSCDRSSCHHRSANHHRHAHFSRRHAHRPRYGRSMRRRRSH